MIVTIDGPAGAGKSTVAKRTARRLGFDYLDTGAMYRAVALAGIRAGVDWNVPEQLEALLPNLDIRFDGERVLLNGEDVSEAVRTPEVTAVTRFAADNPTIRAELVRRQQEIGATRNLVTEGRDQGTVVFPHAECKIYLWASPEE
ncbi:MAG: (d)CMP kinase, partial [Planctomycetota bacterium]